MVPRFSWLAVSDIHLKADADTWAQQVVLRDLVRHVETRRSRAPKIEFILVNGDLAYSGQAQQYEQVRSFLGELCNAAQVPPQRVFLAPGNHDIDRSRQTTCYQGARSLLKSAQEVDSLLGSEEERSTLFQRFAAFRQFEADFCRGQEREITPDGIVSLSILKLGPISLAIASLNSAWLCGGDDDERRIIVGERAIINLVELLRQKAPRLVVSMFHHPPDWLTRFDQQAVEIRLRPKSDFLHRGHLHEPSVELVRTEHGSSCITIATGAGFSGRQFPNSYALVEVDIQKSRCFVTNFLYDTISSDFTEQPHPYYPCELRGAIPATVQELAAGIRAIDGCPPTNSHYLAALLHRRARDVPIEIDGILVTGSPELLQEGTSQELKSCTEDFLAAKNVLLAYDEGVPLSTRLMAAKESICAYASRLESLTSRDPSLRATIAQRESEWARVSVGNGSRSASFIVQLMNSLVSSCEWDALEEVAVRNLTSSDVNVKLEAKRKLAISLANSDEPERRRKAETLAIELAHVAPRAPDDFLLAAMVLQRNGDTGRAKELLCEGLTYHSTECSALLQFGRQLVTETGDQELRRLLESVQAEQKR